VLLPVLLLIACTSDTDMRRARQPLSETTAISPSTPEKTPDKSRATPTPQPEAAPAPTEPPHPNLSLPGGSTRVAVALERTHGALDDYTDRWLDEGGDLAGSKARSIELWALYQQRLYRKLSQSPSLARSVRSELPQRLRATMIANVTAQRELLNLVAPVRPPIHLKTYEPASPHDLRRWHESAGKRFGLPWEVLASVNLVESRFGRILGPSSAGALGPMQFLPSTWEQYGAGGDIMNPRDAINGAARYLTASGAPGDMRGALFAYNRSDAYVDAILQYANEMKRDDRSFYSYYFWQVFVRTTEGDVQLTGPGADKRLID
jgi:soluble lytic murein transglycosylase-like protein